jgi:hypothetical protein
MLFSFRLPFEKIIYEKQPTCPIFSITVKSIGASLISDGAFLGGNFEKNTMLGFN